MLEKSLIHAEVTVFIYFSCGNIWTIKQLYTYVWLIIIANKCQRTKYLKYFQIILYVIKKFARNVIRKNAIKLISSKFANCYATDITR